MKFSCLIVLLTTWQFTYSNIYRGEGENGSFYLFEAPNLTTNNCWDYFFDACFTLPHLLFHAAKTNTSVYLVIPKSYTGYSPLDLQAPLIEGSRIALAWMSAFYRFESLGNVDCKVLLISDEIKQNIQAVLEYGNKLEALDRHETPEENMAHRLYHVPSFLKQTTSIQLTPFLISQTIKSRCIIPSLAKSDKKRILITGGAGFIGSYLCEHYLKAGYQVICIDTFLTSNSDNIAPLLQSHDFSFHNHDITKPYSIDGPIEMIFHFASVPSPADYYNMPVETLTTGLNGTKHAVELAIEKKARFIFASSSEVYGDPEVHPQCESYVGAVNPIGKRSQYDQSKRGGETLIKYYYDTHHIDARIIRIFNTFGPRMRLNDGRVITNFINATLCNTPMIIYGDGTQTRSPSYVTDLIHAIVKIAETPSNVFSHHLSDRVFNAGSSEEFFINEIACFINEIMHQYLKAPLPTKHIPQFDKTDPKKRKPDLTKLQTVTSYIPEVSFKDGLKKMFTYYHHLQ